MLLSRSALRLALAGAMLLARGYARADSDPLLQSVGRFKKAVVLEVAQAPSGGKSVGAAPQAVAGALMKAEQEIQKIGGQRPTAWDAAQSKAHWVLSQYQPFVAQGQSLIKRQYLQTVVQAGGPVDQVVALLSRPEYGANVALQPEPGAASAKSVVAAAALKISVQLKYKGKGGLMKLVDGSPKKVLAAIVPKPTYYRVNGHDHLVVALETANEETVYLSRLSSLLEDEPAVWQKAAELSGGTLLREGSEHFPEVMFPKVSFNAFETDGRAGLMPEFEGAKASGTAYTIRKLALQSVFELDESGTIPPAKLTAPPDPRIVPYEVNGPFLVWMKADNAVVFAAQITRDSMSQPKRR